jgi:hypothetical protein
MKKDTAKLWVKVIAILGIIGAVITIIGGLIAMFGGTFLSALIPLMGGALVGAVLIFTSILILVIGVLELIVSLSLWRYKEWSRITGIVLAVLGVIGGLTTLPMGILTLIIYGGIFYLLALNKDVKKLFRR